MSESKLSRKDFVRLGAGSAAALWLGGCATVEEVEDEVDPDPDPLQTGDEYDLDYNNPFNQGLHPAWVDGTAIKHLNLNVAVERPPFDIADQYIVVYEDAFDNPEDPEVSDFMSILQEARVKGQYPIFDSGPNDPNYSAIWHNHWVIVPRSFEPNTLRSEDAVLGSEYEVIESPFYVN